MTAKLPVVTSSHLLRALYRAGFVKVRQSGSHISLKHPSRPQFLVIVPAHSNDVSKGTLKNILRQANLTIDQLRELL